MAFPVLTQLSKNKVLTGLNEKWVCYSKMRQWPKCNNTSNFVPTQVYFCSLLPERKNLLVFPAAVPLAFGLYTGLCSGHRGHVHCLGAWRRRDRQTDRWICYTPASKSIQCVKASRRTFIFTMIQIVEDDNYSINFTTVLF